MCLCMIVLGAHCGKAISVESSGTGVWLITCPEGMATPVKTTLAPPGVVQSGCGFEPQVSSIQIDFPSGAKAANLFGPSAPATRFVFPGAGPNSRAANWFVEVFRM